MAHSAPHARCVADDNTTTDFVDTALAVCGGAVCAGAGDYYLPAVGALPANRTLIPVFQNLFPAIGTARHTLFDGLISCSSVLTALNLCQRFPPSTPLFRLLPSLSAVNSFHQTARNFSLLLRAHPVASVYTSICRSSHSLSYILYSLLMPLS